MKRRCQSAQAHALILSPCKVRRLESGGSDSARFLPCLRRGPTTRSTVSDRVVIVFSSPSPTSPTKPESKRHLVKPKPTPRARARLVSAKLPTLPTADKTDSKSESTARHAEEVYSEPELSSTKAPFEQLLEVSLVERDRLTSCSTPPVPRDFKCFDVSASVTAPHPDLVPSSVMHPTLAFSSSPSPSSSSPSSSASSPSFSPSWSPSSSVPSSSPSSSTLPCPSHSAPEPISSVRISSEEISLAEMSQAGMSPGFVAVEKNPSVALRFLARAAQGGHPGAAFVLADHIQRKSDKSLLWPRTDGFQVKAVDDIYRLHPAAHLFLIAATALVPGAANGLASLLLSWSFRDMELQPLSTCVSRILSLASSDTSLLQLIIAARLPGLSSSVPPVSSSSAAPPSSASPPSAVAPHSAMPPDSAMPPPAPRLPSFFSRAAIPSKLRSLATADPDASKFGLRSLSECLDDCAEDKKTTVTSADADQTTKKSRALLCSSEAVRWLRLASVCGDLDASCQLAEYLLVDAKLNVCRGVRLAGAQSVREAFEHWVSAARRGHLPSMHYVGLCLIHGLAPSASLVPLLLSCKAPESKIADPPELFVAPKDTERELVPPSVPQREEMGVAAQEGFLLLGHCALVYHHAPSLRELGWWHILHSNFEEALTCLRFAAHLGDGCASGFLHNVTVLLKNTRS